MHSMRSIAVLETATGQAVPAIRAIALLRPAVTLESDGMFSSLGIPEKSRA
ncbi:hypothetical protein OI25_8254 (plasmid) [Paraburkholderia fungorum]|jgi:hypothetical protein|uniref:Uncharacterized protein n=1 Tax=Paraburkholderia fungorum TaxID=134537 RepID=A0AAW3V3S2_9BURK|nr:hypothetical protein OI25_8254 [Paraburkholderia fungorum]MBB4516556.1 hypothetical protein [Paraburkholderia fungorum]MBB5545186.1 hypothetical protein [Paraburkholderia fungorum]MBB6204971.1 hypothetical protein [Paraburkholderia fungorum]PRZ52553.1 hypothetical protein BX589_114229 [Paraburkholderia fungorum]